MRDIFKYISIFTTKQKKEFAVLFVIMIVGAVLEAVGIGAILPLISLIGQVDYLADHKEVAEIIRPFGIENHTELIIACAVVLIILYIMKNIYIAFEIHIQRRFAEKNQILYSKELMAHYLNEPYSRLVEVNTAVLLRNVNQGSSAIFSQMLVPILNLCTEILTVIAIWIMLVVVDPFTATIVAGIMAFVVMSILKLFRKEMVRQGEIDNEASASYIKWINQGLGAIKETKVMRKEEFFLEAFSNDYSRYAKARQRYYFLAEMPRIIIECLVICSLLLLIIYKVIIETNPQSIVPVLGVLALAAFRLMPSANRIVGFYNAVKNQMPFFNEIYPDLVQIREKLSSNRKTCKKHSEQHISFIKLLEVKNLFFRYNQSQKYILEDVSFCIPKGKFIGIMGPSGAGKTTFIDILLGLLKPSSGQILCDGIDINKNIRSWQANLAYVPQDIYLIDGSVAENIALGENKDDIDMALLNRVMSMAELSDFVLALPEGIDTFVGERGVKLSGGQRQRIGIARALYQKPELLILDEATSALDNDTEKSITDTILKLKGQITIIAIAHRLSTLAECDYKIEFKDGQAFKV